MLSPAHREKLLNESTLTEESLTVLGWQSINHEEALTTLRRSPSSTAPQSGGIRIPYPDPVRPELTSHCRVRFDSTRYRKPGYSEPIGGHAETLQHDSEKEWAEGPKYLGPAGEPTRIYVPHLICPKIHDPAEELLLVEGEKKAIAGCQAGFATVALPGVDNFGNSGARYASWGEGKDERSLHPDFQHLKVRDRTVIICFDSDIDSNPRVLGAAARLGKVLAEAGAKVQIAYINGGISNEKLGLDDLLARRGREGLYELEDSFRPFNVVAVVEEFLEEHWRQWSASVQERELRRAVILARKLMNEHQFATWCRKTGQTLRIKVGEVKAHIEDDEENEAKQVRGDKYTTLVNIVRSDRNVVPVLPQFNSMSQTVEFEGAELLELDVLKMRERLGQLGIRYLYGKEDILDGLVQVAHERAYHPVQQYLDGLEWDGVARLAGVAEKSLGATGALARVLVRKWFISAVARALAPGCKVDTALILVGGQGLKKSTFFKTLAGRWFCDTSIDLSNKDAYAVLRRSWIFEWPELETMQRARSYNTVKAFLTSTEDIYRPPYGRVPVTVKRSFVIVGTTNDDEFLNDPTGDRRYWPVEVTVESIDVAALAAERDQLWAEAVAAFRHGQQWWLTPEEEKLLAESQRKHKMGSPWEDRIVQYVEGKIPVWRDNEQVFPEPLEWVATSALLEKAIGKPVEHQSRKDAMDVATVMRRLRWKAEQREVNGNRSRGWARPEAGP